MIDIWLVLVPILVVVVFLSGMHAGIRWEKKRAQAGFSFVEGPVE